MTANALPTKEEINPIPDDLDGQTAVDDFLGKSLEEAEEMFRENSGHSWESLCYIGPVAFRFYVPAAIKYLHDELSNTNPPTVSWFIYVIESWLDYHPHELKPVASALSRLFEQYLAQYLRFDEHDAIAAWAVEHFRDNPIIPPEALAILQEARDAAPSLRTSMTKVQERLSEICGDSLGPCKTKDK